MRVLIDSWRGKQEMDLADALNPRRSVATHDSGAVEIATDTADEACDTIGRLLAMLVERNILTLRDASDIAGNYGDIIPYVEEDLVMTLLMWIRGLVGMSLPMTTERRQMMCRRWDDDEASR